MPAANAKAVKDLILRAFADCQRGDGRQSRAVATLAGVIAGGGKMPTLREIEVEAEPEAEAGARAAGAGAGVRSGRGRKTAKRAKRAG